MAKADLQGQAQGQPFTRGLPGCWTLRPKNATHCCPQRMRAGMAHLDGRRQELGHYPALPLSICVTLNKSSCPPEPHIPQLGNGGSNTLCMVPEKRKQDEAA